MRLLNDLKVVHKALPAPAAMAASALGATWHPANRLTAIDTLYGNLLDQEANAALLDEARILERMTAVRSETARREAYEQPRQSEQLAVEMRQLVANVRAA